MSHWFGLDTCGTLMLQRPGITVATHKFADQVLDQLGNAVMATYMGTHAEIVELLNTKSELSDKKKDGHRRPPFDATSTLDRKQVIILTRLSNWVCVFSLGFLILFVSAVGGDDRTCSRSVWTGNRSTASRTGPLTPHPEIRA
eukprot:3932990-Rhodomonas_salina.2